MSPHNSPIRLGVNIDHVATLRNARGEGYPDPLEAAQLAIDSGAYGITAHLREDRRHIKDDDIFALKRSLTAPLNMEMAATKEMLTIAKKIRPHSCCLVPEKRQELTTEGGLNVLTPHAQTQLKEIITQLHDVGIKVALFIDPDIHTVEASKKLNADAVELHTGDYAARPHVVEAQIRLKDAARAAHACGLDVHAGHGLTFDNVEAIAALDEITELNIGHFIIAQSIFYGLALTIAKMQHHITKGVQRRYETHRNSTS